MDLVSGIPVCLVRVCRVTEQVAKEAGSSLHWSGFGVFW